MERVRIDVIAEGEIMVFIEIMMLLLGDVYA